METGLNGEGLRGTGRTTAQVAALPEGSIYIVINRANGENIKAMTGRDDIKYVAFNDDANRYRGIRIPAFDVDHYVVEYIARQNEVMRDEFERLCATMKVAVGK